MIAGGTILGGRYLIEGERPDDRDALPSWWALDRQLQRRVVVVVMPSDAGSLDVARTARLDYVGRLLDGGEHDGRSYLVIRAERGTPPATSRIERTGPPPGPAGAPTAAMGALRATRAMPAPPIEHADATGALPPPPVVHADATEAIPRPVSDPTTVQPLPAYTGAPPPPYGAYPPGMAADGTRRPVLSNRTIVRSAVLMAVSFVLGATGVFALGILAEPEPLPPAPVSASVDQGSQPDRTLPGDPGPSPTTPLETVDPEVTTTTNRRSSSTTADQKPSSTTKPTKPTTTRRRRGRATTVDEG